MGLSKRSHRPLPILVAVTTVLLVVIGAIPAVAQQPDIFRSELPTPLASREISLRFEKLGLEQGLSQATVYDMMQDRHGFMWFSTQDGINRFDGYEIKVYRHAPFDSTSLPVGWSTALMEDSDGGIWVGGIGKVGRMDPVTESFKVYLHNPDVPTSFPNAVVQRMLQDRDGVIWFTTWNAGGFDPGGLVRMDPDRPGIFHNYRHDPDDETSISHDNLRGILEESNGSLWVASSNGLNRVAPDPDPSNIRFEQFLTESPDPDNPNANRMYHMYERPDEPGVLWIGSRRGLIRFEPVTGDKKNFLPDPGGDDNVVLAMAPDPQNRTMLWVTIASDGIAKFDLKTEQFYHYRSDPNDPNGLSSDATGSIYTDRSGVVWVETRGIERFNPAAVGFEYVKTNSQQTSLAGHVVWGIELGPDNTLWITSFDEARARPSLLEIDRNTGETRQHLRDPDNPNSRPRGARALLVDASGTLWYGASGLARLHRETGRFIHFEADETDPKKLQSSEITDLFEDRSGFVWISGDKGLSRWDPRQPDRFISYRLTDINPMAAPDDVILTMSEDQAGFLLLATTVGVSRLDPLSGRATNFNHDPKDPNTLTSEFAQCAHERRREPGIIWVCSGSGLNRIDIETGLVTHFTVEDGLPNNHLYAILEDDEGRLWMSTNGGLSRFEPETATFRNFGMEVGLQSLEFDLWAAHRGDNGEMFFGGINGVNAFFPNELIESSVPPEVRIVDLRVSGESIKGSGIVDLSEPVPDVDQITLAHDQKDVTFDFVGFHYEHPEQNVFSYKLEGYNDDWIDGGHTRTASYTNLAPGEYTFRVKSANSAGVWNEEGASIRVVIHPPFWATWWFRVLAALGLTSLLYLGYSARVRQVEARARELEGQVNERTAELKASNIQLEQSHTIVEAINQETSFGRLLTRILDEAHAIQGVEKATALVYSKDDGLFRVRASSGWDADAMKGIGLTQRQARERYVDNAENVAEDIFIAKDVAGRTGSDQMAEFGKVASFMVLRVKVEDEVAGYLVFDNLSDPDAFARRDVELLERLREHIQSAFIKTRILEDLQDTLSDLQSTQDRLVHSEKMASLGQLTAGIAHEIRNPLNFVNNFSDLTIEMVDELAAEVEANRSEIPERLAEEFDSLLEGLKLNADKILEHGRRADGIVHSMLQHSSGGEGELVDVALNALLEEYLNLAYHGVRAREPEFNATLERDYDVNVERIEGIPQDLGRVFLNLIGNAFDALRVHGSNGRPPTLTVKTAKLDGQVEIRISDNGPGIPEDVKARIFEPFFTTKPTGSGTGLGLSMSYDIITKGHGGSLQVESEPGEGATFIVRLPA